MFRAILFVVVSLVVSAASVHAKSDEKKAVVADTPEKFTLLVEAIRQEMAPGKRYEFLDSRNTEEVNQILDRMGSMLAKAGSVDAMHSEQKAQLMSDQERVNGILARNADDRLVCTHVAPVGSHLPVTRCRSVREIAKRRETVRKQTRELDDERRAIQAEINNGKN
jgi:hypothetical protein